MEIKDKDTKVGNVYYAVIQDEEHIGYDIAIAKTICVKRKRRKLTQTYINGEYFTEDVEWEDEYNCFKIEEIVFSLKNISVNVGEVINRWRVYSEMSEAFEELRCSIEQDLILIKDKQYDYSTGKHVSKVDKPLQQYEKYLFNLLKSLKDNSIVTVCTAKEDMKVEIPLEFYNNEFHKTSGTKYNTVAFDKLQIDNHDGFRCSTKEYSIIRLPQHGRYYIVDKKPTTARFYKESVLAKAVIPKGSKYFVDTNGEIVTNQIKLLYPFFDKKIKTKWFDELEDTEGIV